MRLISVDDTVICRGGCGRQRADCNAGWARGVCDRCRIRLKREGRYEQVALPPEVPRNLFEEFYPIGTTRKQRTGYVTIKTKDGWKPEHRHVMEQQLGRPLAPGENVHHRDGVRDNNDPDNLELWYVPQLRGQRVADLIEYVTKWHGDSVREALNYERHGD